MQHFLILLIELALTDFYSLLVPGILSEACHEGALGGRVYFSSFMCARVSGHACTHIQVPACIVSYVLLAECGIRGGYSRVTAGSIIAQNYALTADF